MRTYGNGASVSVTEGPFEDTHGVVVSVDADRRELYLVRFSAPQQMDVEERQIVPWSSEPRRRGRDG